MTATGEGAGPVIMIFVPAQIEVVRITSNFVKNPCAQQITVAPLKEQWCRIVDTTTPVTATPTPPAAAATAFQAKITRNVV